MIDIDQTTEDAQEQAPTSDYFAAAAPDDIGSELMGKVDRYYAYIVSSSLARLWATSYRHYYGMSSGYSTSWSTFDVGDLIPGGEQGEVTKIKVNQFRNFITHLLVLTTSDRPEMTTRAINSDSASLAQAFLGNGILDYYMREKSWSAT